MSHVSLLCDFSSYRVPYSFVISHGARNAQGKEVVPL